MLCCVCVCVARPACRDNFSNNKLACYLLMRVNACCICKREIAYTEEPRTALTFAVWMLCGAAEMVQQLRHQPSALTDYVRFQSFLLSFSQHFNTASTGHLRRGFRLRFTRISRAFAFFTSKDVLLCLEKAQPNAYPFIVLFSFNVNYGKASSKVLRSCIFETAHTRID